MHDRPMALASLEKYRNVLEAKPPILFAAMFTIVLCSRIPFITNSYGIDGDGWRAINVARTIASSHQYITSRFPGYPFFELSLAALNAPPAWITNSITAVFSSIAAAFFTLLVRRYSPRYIAAGMAFAFTPVIFINSTVTMDYLWALCFIIIALYLFFVRRSFLLGGICIGLATGCRMTSILMTIPLLLLLLRQKDWKESGYFFLTSILTGGILFIPVIASYGFSFLSFTEGSYSIASIAKKLTVDVWGVGGSLFLAATILLSMRPSHHFSPIEPMKQIRLLVFGSLGLYVILFLRLPVDAGYLIPCIPMVILYLSVSATGTLFRWFTAAIVASSFLISLSPSDRPWHPTPSPCSIEMRVGERTMVIDLFYGPVIKEQHKIHMQEHYLNRIGAFLDQRKSTTALLTGDFISKIATLRGISLLEHTAEDYYDDQFGVIAAYAGSDVLRNLETRGYQIFHLPDVGKMNMDIYGVFLEKFGSREILKERKDF